MQSPMVLDGLESNLASLFKPVEPSQVFVESLAVRLKRPKPVQLEKAGKTPLLLVVIGSGLLFGVLIFLILRLVRLILYKR
ncbi:hypothetical protein BECAL_01719 [Bellilinea caldifistulae]|uniref:Tyrosine kinase G-rich domain-containing protein n=2 Tax=Bellilinea caldifistulae TaxID=360411 RepID=A0A0P6X1V7_9CHLR|nr:hypothetical protein AC812_10385 [Bellilinea caldifistulae]GAP10549.1 hypothetical protein BECAL_01719 [Bellilinea caldifistulae]